MLFPLALPGVCRTVFWVIRPSLLPNWSVNWIGLNTKCLQTAEYNHSYWNEFDCYLNLHSNTRETMVYSSLECLPLWLWSNRKNKAKTKSLNCFPSMTQKYFLAMANDKLNPLSSKDGHKIPCSYGAMYIGETNSMKRVIKYFSTLFLWWPRLHTISAGTL